MYSKFCLHSGKAREEVLSDKRDNECQTQRYQPGFACLNIQGSHDVAVVAA